jgi:hypothetical protein
MDTPEPCPFRYIFKGRTFCAVAIRERRYTTAEVVPSACRSCRALQIIRESGCGRMDLGIEVDQYGGSLDVNIHYASCEALVERLTDFSGCSQARCPLWAPLDEERFAAIRQEALQAQREAERGFTG